MILFWLTLLAIQTAPEGITGGWDLYRDDDTPGQAVDKESLLIYPDGRLEVISLKRSFDIHWTTEEDRFVFIFKKNSQNDRVSRPFVLEGDILKMKNEKVGYVWYRRSDMKLPEIGTAGAWRDITLGDFKMKAPGDWEVIKPTDDTQRIVMQKTSGKDQGFAMFVLLRAGTWESAGEKVKDLIAGFAESVGLAPTVLRHRKEPFFGFGGGYLMFEHKPPGEHLKYAIKSFSLDDGRLMIVAAMHKMGFPPKDMEEIIDSVRVSGTGLKKNLSP